VFQTILNILTNPIMIPILIGIVGASHRGWVKIQEQRSKSTALQERRRAERDALRTGRAPKPSSSRSEPAPETSASDERRKRIEALRQKRIEQLRKLREQRTQAGAPEPQATAQAPARPQQTQRSGSQRSGAQRAAAPGQLPPRRTQRPAPVQAAQTPQQRQQQQHQTQQRLQQQRQRPGPRTPEPGAQRRRQAEPEAAAVAKVPDLITPTEIGSDPSREIGARAGAGSSRGSGMFATRADLRRAVIAREVMGPPVGLRRGGAMDA